MAPNPQPPFATFLLPAFSFPFRRRHSSTASTTTTTTTSSTIDALPSLSSSPNSSTTSTPSSSPPSTSPFSSLSRAFHLHNIFESPAPPQKSDNRTTKLTRTSPNTLKCITCATDIAFSSQIVSKGFTGRHGRAYLVSPPPASTNPKSGKRNKDKEKSKKLINTKIGRAVNRELLTGAHVVADVSCTICGTVLGWKYVDAKEGAQRYKIGKYILEMKRVICGVGWENVEWDNSASTSSPKITEDDAFREGGEGEKEYGEEDEVVVFDSEDEDECEDLFAGIWDPEVVAKRRGRRIVSRKKEGVA